MKNTTKTLLVAVLTVVIITPSVTFAAWYNPFSWSIWDIFKKSTPAPVVQTVPSVSEIPNNSPATTTATTTSKAVPVVPKPVAPKVATQTTVTNEITDEQLLQELRDALQSDWDARSQVARDFREMNDGVISNLEKEKQMLESSPYKEQYAKTIEIFEKIIQNRKAESAEINLMVDSPFKPKTPIEQWYPSSVEYYNKYFVSFDHQTDLMLYDINTANKMVALANDYIEALINQQEIEAMFAPYKNLFPGKTVDQISLEIQQNDQKFNDNIKELQEKVNALKGNSETRKKVQQYLKTIIYYPIN